MHERPKASSNDLAHLLDRASARWDRRIAARFAGAGWPEVRPAFGAVLAPLLVEEGLRMGDLAARAGCSKQTMTTLVRAMETVGLVTRTREAGDERSVRVRLTEKARRFAPTAAAIVREEEAALVDRLGPGGLERLKSSLRTLSDGSREP